LCILSVLRAPIYGARRTLRIHKEHKALIKFKS
jgi:hypothetical protein